MTGIVVRLLPVIAALSFSCGGPQKFVPDHKEQSLPLLIWVDPGSEIPEADTLKACEEWKLKGIRCYIVKEKLRSHIQIFSQNEKGCVKNKDGTRTLATAWRGGKIIFNIRCFGPADKLNQHKFRAVMVHEIGHHLGIWSHVPSDCKDKDVKKHPSGKSVCGVAIMNPYYDKDIHFITPVDSLAFDIRNRFIAVVVDQPPGTDPEEPDCTYHSK